MNLKKRKKRSKRRVGRDITVISWRRDEWEISEKKRRKKFCLVGKWNSVSGSSRHFTPLTIFSQLVCWFEQVATCSSSRRHMRRSAGNSKRFLYMHGKFSRTIRSICATYDISISVLYLWKTNFLLTNVSPGFIKYHKTFF